jgi:DNA (cytosine-5)-methyltransferase 1
MYREMRDYLGGVSFRDDLNRGGIFLPHKRGNVPAGRYGDWIADVRLDGVLNHETRGHMVSDLARYMFCTAFAATRNGRSPRIPEFPDDLIPAHKSWKKKVFMDRFKVQPKNDQSGTITSHIAKDGHYFIHFDTAQCRSMTVREAARLQSFPDNYFFRGNRTQQFTQVGNAVPPLLARDIAGVVWKIVSA